MVFHELTKEARLLACQQKVPAPSKVNGVVMVEVTGLQVPTAGVNVRVGETPRVGVFVRIGVFVRVAVGPLVGVRLCVAVLVNPAVAVRVKEAVAPGVKVRVGVLVAATGEAPSVGVGVKVRLGVDVDVEPQFVSAILATPDAAVVTMLSVQITLPLGSFPLGV